MELDKMLQYQKTDIVVYKLEREYQQSKERELLMRCKKAFEDKKSTLIGLSKELDNTLATITKLSETIDELVKSGSEWNGFDANAVATEEELAKIEKDFADYEAKVAELSKELTKAVKKEDEIAYENKRLNEEMEVLNNDFRHLTGLLKKKEADMLEKAKPHVKILKTLAPDIDKKLFEKYQELRKGRKMPAIVPYNEGCCGGCGMDISIEVGKKLVNAYDVAECTHCGRIVYKPKPKIE